MDPDYDNIPGLMVYGVYSFINSTGLMVFKKFILKIALHQFVIFLKPQ